MIEEVVVRQAKYEDLEKVQNFLSKEWPLNREYYEHFHVIDGEFMFVIGEGKISKKIYGTCGLIVTNREKEKDYQLVLLLVDKNNHRFNSISMIKYIAENMQAKTISSCGVRPNALIIYELLGYETGVMDHFYKLADRERYNVAVVQEKKIIKSRSGCRKLKYVKTFDELERLYDFTQNKNANPYKDAWCIKHRYFDVPHHKYKVYIIENEGEKNRSLIVMREVQVKGNKICKIVDFIGEDSDMSYIGNELDKLMNENNYEYIDLYSVGISKEIMEQAGFVLRTNEDKNIIPQLFEPFICKNKDIYYFTSNSERFHIYRGDCDQDRAVIGFALNI